MLAALPGLGSTESFKWSTVSFGFREQWNCLDEAENSASRAYCSAEGLTVIADVRLDNRTELLDMLGNADLDKAKVEDCEILIHAYERWGEDCPLHLYGDYAFAIWDSRKNRLFCARDAVGARPFFYSKVDKGKFVFASAVAALVALPDVDDCLNEAEVATYLRGGMPDERNSTFFVAVRSLTPGHCITVNSETEHSRRWWKPDSLPLLDIGSDDDCEQEFLDLYRQAVRNRLQDRHPVGVHLSGGLDSSSIAVLAAQELKLSGRRPHAFCWHPPPDNQLTEEESNEYRLIESVCVQESLSPHYHSLSVDHMLDMLGRDVVRFPNRDGTLMHELQVQRTASKLGVRVILSGWGGDEIASFSGEGYFIDLFRKGHFARLLAGQSWRMLIHKVLRLMLSSRTTRIPAALLRGKRLVRIDSFMHPALERKHRKKRKKFRFVSIRKTQLALLLGGALERRIEDWASSGAQLGIEYRYPLLDRRLIEFVLSLPPDQFRRGLRTRWFIRRALQSVLPAKILEGSVKTDPARFRPMYGTLNEALPAIIRDLDSRSPVRVEYIDMVRLRRYMEKRPSDSKRQGTGKLMRALSFLDWRMD